MTLSEILTQDKSDRAVIKQALTEGYNGVQIRRSLMRIYPLDFPTEGKAVDFYESVTSNIPIEFFLNLKSIQNEKV